MFVTRKKIQKPFVTRTNILVYIGLILGIIFLVATGSNRGVSNSFILFPSPTFVPTITRRPTVTTQPSSTPLPTSTPTPSPPSLTPTPSPTPTPFPSTSYDSLFDEFSETYKVDKTLLKRIAFCESGVSPGAQNGEYGGMYQFTADTWRSTRKEMGLDENPDLRFGAREAIETAAFKISRGGHTAWATCLYP